MWKQCDALIRGERALSKFVVIALLLAVAAGLATGQESASHADPAPIGAPPRGRDLLTSAYDLSSHLSQIDRCYLLVNLSMAAAALSDDRLKPWTDEVFRETATLPASWNVTAMKKNAVVALAATEPMQALKMLIELPFAHVSDGDVPPEDLRADAAKKVFRWAWEKTEKLDQIEAAAVRLGETGQYPYVAMAPIISALNKSGNPAARRLFSSSVTYYKRGNPTRFATPDFVAFLGLVDGSVPERDMIDAVRAVQSRLSDPKQDLFGEESFEGIIETENGPSVILSRSQFLLLQLMPLIRRLDESWAAALVTADPVLGDSYSTRFAVDIQHRVRSEDRACGPAFA